MYIRQTYNIEALIGSLLQAPTWIIQEYYRGSAVRGYSRIVIVFYVFVQGDDNDAPANRLWEQVISIWGNRERERWREREAEWGGERKGGGEGERRGDEMRVQQMHKVLLLSQTCNSTQRSWIIKKYFSGYKHLFAHRMDCSACFPPSYWAAGSRGYFTHTCERSAWMTECPD